MTYSDALSRPEMHDKPQSGMKRRLSPTDSPEHPKLFITDINVLKNNLEECDFFCFFPERIVILETSELSL